MIKKDLASVYSSSLNNPLSGSDYYLIASKNDEKNTVMGIFSKWIDFADEKRSKEIRQLSLVKPEDAKKDLVFLQKDPLTINSKEELSSFLKFGGYALVDKPLIDNHLIEIAEPVTCSNSLDRGFIQYETLPQKNKNRFARDKFRAEIFNRDNCQCRICGSSTDDSVHVRLEVHHIKPWEEGGLTLKDNLITLCNACHSGANNFDRWKLYNKIGIHSYYQNSTFFTPLPSYTSDQCKKSIFMASNVVEILIKIPSNI